jgi:transposase
MPKTIVPDNMEAIVVSADPLSPRLREAFADYVQARGILVDPARVRSPQDKPRVENQVAHVRESWFDGEC